MVSLFCAGVAAQRGLKALVVEEIRISGSERCNFTNHKVTHAHFSGQKSGFVRSALSRYMSRDFLALMQKYSTHPKQRTSADRVPYFAYPEPAT